LQGGQRQAQQRIDIIEMLLSEFILLLFYCRWKISVCAKIIVPLFKGASNVLVAQKDSPAIEE
jgi:hypothetical protein